MVTLYKRTSTGAVQIWRQELNAEGTGFRTISGQQDGAQVTSEWTICTPKNVGRANETTAQAQALAEVEANYTKKLAQGGYHESIETIDEPKFFAPMLAKGYEDHPPTAADFAAGKVFSQPKLDGMRAIVKADGVWSRQGKPIVAVPHVYEAVKYLFVAAPNLVLDGELYNHGLKEDFNKIISLCKKQKPTAADLAESASLIQYWCYDAALPEAFADRTGMLEELAPLFPTVTLVPTLGISSQEMLDREYAIYLEDGYEGQMVRISGAPYEQKRTKQLLKRKETKDAEFPILGVHEGLGNRSGMAGYMRLALPDGREFRANIKGDRAYLKQLLQDAETAKGKQATVEFFMYTPDGIPRFPRVKTIRDYENR